MARYEEVRPILMALISGLRAETSRPLDRLNILDDIDIFIEASNKIDTMRVLISATIRNRETLPSSIVGRLMNEASSFRTLRFYKNYADRRLGQVSPRSSAELLEVFYGVKNPTVSQALDVIFEVLTDLNFQRELPLDDKTPAQAAEQLQRIVPVQKVAPAQFFIDHDNNLRIDHKDSRPHAVDAANVDAARLALLEQSETILENLRLSNCDRRILEAVESLNAKLHNMVDVVQLGIQNISCEELRVSFEPELPTALLAMIKGHTSAISLYVAQFPEWQQFTDNAARVELNAEDIRELRNVAEELAETLENDEFVDEEVPATIRFLASAARDTRGAGRRTAFALLRSLENLIAVTFKFIGDTVQETAQQTKKTIAKSLSLVIGGFAAAILASALSVTPIFSKFSDTAWMKTAAPLVQNLLINLSKPTSK